MEIKRPSYFVSKKSSIIIVTIPGTKIELTISEFKIFEFLYTLFLNDFISIV